MQILFSSQSVVGLFFYKNMKLFWEDGYHRQQHRYCESTQKDTAFCEGPWLELIPCGQCETPLTEEDDYNYDLDLSSRAHIFIKLKVQILN